MAEQLLHKAKELADINGDGKIDATDVQQVQQKLDMNKDGKVDTKDLDLNNDGKVDWKDLVFFYSKYQEVIKSLSGLFGIIIPLIWIFWGEWAIAVSILSIATTQFFNIIKDGFQDTTGKIRALERTIVDRNEIITQQEAELRIVKAELQLYTK